MLCNVGHLGIMFNFYIFVELVAASLLIKACNIPLPTLHTSSGFLEVIKSQHSWSLQGKSAWYVHV